MLTLFGKNYDRKLTEIEFGELSNIYDKALSRYTDEQVKEAGYKCMEELHYYPKPSHIIERITKTQPSQGKLLFDTCRCSKCHEVKWCIKEDDIY